MTEVMLGGYDNAYSNPEKLGLEIFGMAEDTDMSYEFNMFAVWRDSSGQLYFANDSGCSCPSPFEDYRKISDLKAGTVPEIHAALTEWAGTDSSYHHCEVSAAELHAKLAGIGHE